MNEKDRYTRQPGAGTISLSPFQILKEVMESGAVTYERLYDLESEGRLAVAVIKSDGSYRVTLWTPSI